MIRHYKPSFDIKSISPAINYIINSQYELVLNQKNKTYRFSITPDIINMYNSRYRQQIPEEWYYLSHVNLGNYMIFLYINKEGKIMMSPGEYISSINWDVVKYYNLVGNNNNLVSCQ